MEPVPTSSPKPIRRPRSSRWGWIALFMALVVLGAACGDDEADSTTGDTNAADGTTTTSGDTDATDDAGTDDEDDDPADEGAAAIPQRIVSLSSTATEMLFAIGAGDQVIAVDSLSNYPPDAPMTELAAYEPSLEAIMAHDPDLVVYSYDPEGDLLETALTSAGVVALFQAPATSLDDVYAQIAELGVATGQVDGAAALNAEIRDRIESVVASLPAGIEPLRLYHEVDDTFYSASSNSFVGQLYGLLNVENIADAADVDGWGFPQLSAEYILEVDPEIIVISDQPGYDIDDVLARPGWDTITAVRTGNVVAIDADLASRWGPRITEFLEEIAAVVVGASVPG